MMGTSNLIIWLALALLVSLGMVLGLVFLLLGELYCSPFVCRLLGPPFVCRLLGRHASPPNNSTTIAATLTTEDDIEKHTPLSPENQKTPQQNNGEIQKRTHPSSMVYISNPIYDDDENGRMISTTRVDNNDNGTPFETPDSSPSRLGTDESSGDDGEKEEISSSNVVITPPRKSRERKYMSNQWRIQKNTLSRHKK